MTTIRIEELQDKCREIDIIETPNLLKKLIHATNIINDAKIFIDDNIPILLEDMECNYQDYDNIFDDVIEVTLDYIGNNLKYHSDKYHRDKRLKNIPNNNRSKKDKEEYMVKNAKTLLLSLGMNPKGGLRLADDTLINSSGLSKEAFTLSMALYDLIENPSKYIYVDYADKNTTIPLLQLQRPKQTTFKKKLIKCLEKATIRDKQNRVDTFIEELNNMLKSSAYVR